MRLMIVGDLKGQIGAASRIVRNRGAKVTQVDNIALAFDCLCAGHGADLLMVDVQQDIDKLSQLLRTERINVPIVACGVNVDAKTAADAIRAGAQEYIPLPPDEELIAAVLEAIAEESNNVIFASKAMQEVIKLADQVATSPASVLITGESGTGKEVIARYIHAKSSRAAQIFISLNCAAIPENLLESELFGHEKGAFTGAAARRIGKFEEANKGTLLLDEISEMDIRLQSKLLRAVQERVIDRVGGNTPVKVDIRILATSNRDLLSEVQKGNFREDLYFRLNVININIPPLRERPEDIILLGQHFIDKYSQANAIATRKLSAAAMQKMQNYRWPGNVRELENLMHRAVLMAQESEIEAAAINIVSDAGQNIPQAASRAAEVAPSHNQYQTSDFTPLVGQTVADVERELILCTLSHCLGNRTHASNILGISIRTLRNKLKIYGQAE